MTKPDTPITKYKACDLEVRGLAALADDRLLFAGVGFTLRPKQALWLVGDNGSGKTTLLMMLKGLLTPLTGSITAPAAHYIGHDNGLTQEQSVGENLELWLRLYRTADTDIDAWLAQMDLHRERHLDSRQLSQGQKRRLALLRLLLAPRPLWLVDEPQSALDRKGQMILKQWMKRHLLQGGMIVFTDHHQSPVDNCQKITLTSPDGTAAR